MTREPDDRQERPVIRPDEHRIRVFVYGSLLPGLSNHALVRPFVRSVRPGRIAGRLVDAGPYPAVVLPNAPSLTGGEPKVRGLWLDIDAEGLPALDELEDFRGIEALNDYERVWTTDADDPSVSGWVYVWPDDRGCPPAAADWWPDALRRRQAAESSGNRRIRRRE